MTSHRITGGGGIGLNLVETGNVRGHSILFIHGFSLGWLTWGRPLIPTWQPTFDSWPSTCAAMASPTSPVTPTLIHGFGPTTSTRSYKPSTPKVGRSYSVACPRLNSQSLQAARIRRRARSCRPGWMRPCSIASDLCFKSMGTLCPRILIGGLA